MVYLSSFSFYYLFFFFFKQKTAYEMRISDWSSDVCSSDLPRDAGAGDGVHVGIDHGLRLAVDDCDRAKGQQAGDENPQHEGRKGNQDRPHGRFPLSGLSLRWRLDGWLLLRQALAFEADGLDAGIQRAHDVRCQIVGEIAAERRAAIEQQAAILGLIDLGNDRLRFGRDALQRLGAGRVDLTVGMGSLRLQRLPVARHGFAALTVARSEQHPSEL